MHTIGPYALQFIVLILITLPFITYSINPPPSLYIDRVTFWSNTGPPRYQGVGYTFLQPWRTVVATPISGILSILGFEVKNSNYVLSFQVEITSFSGSGVNIFLNPYGTSGELLVIGFTILVLTEVNNFVQLQSTPVYIGPLGSSTQNKLINVTSNSVNLNCSSTFFTYFIQYIKIYSTAVPNYHIWFGPHTIPSHSQLTIEIYYSVPNYIEQIKLGVLMVDQQASQPNTITFSAQSISGMTYTPSFSTDFGVDPSLFGKPMGDYNCITGIDVWDLDPSSGGTYASLAISGTTVTGILFSSNTFGVGYKTVCLAQTFVVGSLIQCTSCVFIPDCLVCYSSNNCAQCSNASFLSMDNSTCYPCNSYMFNCITCTNFTNCTQCVTPYVLSIDNSSCVRCSDYISNCFTCPNIYTCSQCIDYTTYLAPNQTCVPCRNAIPLCVACLSETFCSGCDNLTLYLSSNNSQCLSCSDAILNCYTCDSDTLCFECKDSTTYLVANRTQCLICNTSLVHCTNCLSETVCLFCQNQTILTLSSQCKYCFQIFSNCVNCQSASYCSQCSSLTYLSQDRRQCLFCSTAMLLCLTCSSQSVCTSCSTGNAVTGGCSFVGGCTQVRQSTSYGMHSVSCIQCQSSQLYLDVQTGECICQQGWLVGLYCTSVVGCLSTVNISGNILCSFCDTSRYFYLNSSIHKCECDDGFSIRDNYCRDTCGDGRVFTSQCDDGNLVDGDGCSAECIVEVMYRCVNDGNQSASVCQYINHQIDSTLKTTTRLNKQNIGVFTFDFAPPLPLLKMFNYSDYFQLSAPETRLASVSWEVPKGGETATATVQYLQDLEGKEVRVIFSFDQFFIPYPDIHLQFQAQSDGLALLYYEQASVVDIQTYIYLGISCLVLLLLLVGSWVHKMAAVELLHVLQLIYYLHFTLEQYTITISCMQSLSLVTLNNLFWQNEGQNFSVYSVYQIIPFKPFYAEITLLILAAPLGILLLMILLHLCSLCISRKGISKVCSRIIVRLYNGFIFPCSVGFILPLFLVRAVFQTRSTFQTSFLSPLTVSIFSNLSFSLLAIVVSVEFKEVVIRTSKGIDFSRAKKNYVALYLMFIVLTLMVFWLWVRLGLDWGMYAMIVLVGLMILLQLVGRPYFNLLQNVSIISNMLLLLCFLVYLLIRRLNLVEITKDKEIVVSLSIAGMSLVCIVLTTIRVFIALCSLGQVKPVVVKKVEVNNKKQLQENVNVKAEELTLKKMIEYYANSSICQNKAVLLDQGGNFNEQRFKKAYYNDHKDQIQRKKFIEEQRKKFRKHKQKHVNRQVRQQMGEEAI